MYHSVFTEWEWLGHCNNFTHWCRFKNLFMCTYTFYYSLGKCEVCNDQEAKYTCPRCEVKTCCLTCVNIHKKELECDGQRNKVSYKRISDFTNLDLLSGMWLNIVYVVLCILLLKWWVLICLSFSVSFKWISIVMAPMTLQDKKSLPYMLVAWTLS